MNDTIRLRDGARIEIRPIEPEDRTALEDGFERLSPESRYRRFFGPMPRLSQRELDYLTQVDHHDHEALIAFDEATGHCVGVARYVRTSPEVAEPAVVVGDDFQHRGLGSKLLGSLVERALAEGIRRFDAPVLATNAEAIAILEGLGETAKRREGREVLLSIDLPQRADRPWHTLLRQFATGAIEPARSLLGLLWPRRPGSPDDERRNVIVVGTDCTEDSWPTTDVAAELARASGARIEVVHAHGFFTADREHLAARLGEVVQALRGRGLEVGEHLRRGDPALVLTDLATDLNARLIVVGAGERSTNARRILGSVSDYVAERSPCDVLIARPRLGKTD